MSPIYLLAGFYDFIAPNLFLLSTTASCRPVWAYVSEASRGCLILSVSNTMNCNKLCKFAVFNEKVAAVLAAVF